MLVDARKPDFSWMLLLMLTCLLLATPVYGQQDKQEEYDYVANQVIYVTSFTRISVDYDLHYKGVAAEITATRIKQTPNFERELSDLVKSRYNKGITIGISGEEAKMITATVDDVYVEVYTGERTLRISIKISLKTGLSEAEEAGIRAVVLYMEDKAINLFLNPSLLFTSLINRTLIVDKSMWAEFGAIYPMFAYETSKYRVYTWLYMTTIDVAYQFSEVVIVRDPEKHSRIAGEFNMVLETARSIYSQLPASEASKLKRKVWTAEDKYMYSFSSLPRYIDEIEKSLAPRRSWVDSSYVLAIINVILAMIAGYQVIKIRKRE